VVDSELGPCPPAEELLSGLAAADASGAIARQPLVRSLLALLRSPESSARLLAAYAAVPPVEQGGQGGLKHAVTNALFKLPTQLQTASLFQNSMNLPHLEVITKLHAELALALAAPAPAAAAVETKAAESKPAEVKVAEAAKPAEAKPAEAKPAAAPAGPVGALPVSSAEVAKSAAAEPAAKAAAVPAASAPAATGAASVFKGPVVHEGVHCDSCGVFPIVGIRYQCMVRHHALP
jgi:hypothetical protein